MFLLKSAKKIINASITTLSMVYGFLDQFNDNETTDVY